jgi:hypothetical protein
MSKKFPRTTDDIVCIQGKVWNSLCDEVERLGRLSVAPPLRLFDGAAGPKLSVTQTPDWFMWIVLGTGPVADGTNRWKYSWHEAEKAVQGYGTAGVGGWQSKVGGRYGPSDDFGYAYNCIEDINNGLSIEGNSIDVGLLTGTMELKGVPNAVVLPAWIVRVPGYPTEVWFAYENAIDGECP